MGWAGAESGVAPGPSSSGRCAPQVDSTPEAAYKARTYRLNRVALRRRWARAQIACQQKALSDLDGPGREDWLRVHEVLGDDGLPAMLRSSDVKALGAGLVEWGSHTASHGFLTRLPQRELVREVRASRECLEAITGKTVRFLAYPNGFHDRAAERAVEEAGYEAALAVGDELTTHASPRFAMPRFDVGGHPARMMQLEATGLLGAARKLRGG